MNDLLKINSEMVSNINNTSNVTNTQNSTWKSPEQIKEDKTEQIHQQFLKSQAWGSNLTQENSTGIIPNSNQPKKRSKRECDGCDYVSRSEIEAYYKDNHKAVLRIMGSDKKLRGLIEFNTLKKDIVISQGQLNPQVKFNLNFPMSVWKSIWIQDRNEQTICSMTMRGGSDFADIITENVRKNVGSRTNYYGRRICSYEDGYSMYVYSMDPKTTEIRKNEDNHWVWNTSNFPHQEKFTIWDDKIWSDDVYMKKYFPIVLKWHENNKIFEKDMERQKREDLPRYSEAEIKTWKENNLREINYRLETLESYFTLGTLGQRMDKVEQIIKKFEGKFTELNNKIKDISKDINALKNPNNNNALAKCSSTTSVIGKIFGSFPVIGSAVEGLNWAISNGCSIANAYKPNRGKRDVSAIENKFNDSFIKSINQEQHLPSIANHTNDVVKNTTVTL